MRNKSHINIIFYVTCFYCLLACTQTAKQRVDVEQIELQIIDSVVISKAGLPILLKFKFKGHETPQLILTNSYAQSIINAIIANDEIHYLLPTSFIQKAGICNWQIIYKDEKLTSGNINILPSDNTNKDLETYLGPRSITAGGADYSMLVVVPNDIYDNPLSDGTSVDINEYFETSGKSYALKTQGFITHHKSFSTNRTGNLFIAANTTNAVSKEMTSIVKPAMPTNFTIQYKQAHNFADGNQILEISTNQINDIYGNLISDGTLVNFSVQSSLGNYFAANGTSIRGIANAELQHPQKEQTWSIIAHINGASESNIIEVSFKQATSNFNVKYNPEERLITIDSILSYMNQKVPDGNLIECRLLNHDGLLIYQTNTDSKNGRGMIDLSTQFLAPDIYTGQIKMMGISKSINIEIYDHVD